MAKNLEEARPAPGPGSALAGAETAALCRAPRAAGWLDEDAVVRDRLNFLLRIGRGAVPDRSVSPSPLPKGVPGEHYEAEPGHVDAEGLSPRRRGAAAPGASSARGDGGGGAAAVVEGGVAGCGGMGKGEAGVHAGRAAGAGAGDGGQAGVAELHAAVGEGVPRGGEFDAGGEPERAAERGVRAGGGRFTRRLLGLPESDATVRGFSAVSLGGQRVHGTEEGPDHVAATAASARGAADRGGAGGRADGGRPRGGRSTGDGGRGSTTIQYGGVAGVLGVEADGPGGVGGGFASGGFVRGEVGGARWPRRA
jgi:hypothetical protein